MSPLSGGDGAKAGASYRFVAWAVFIIHGGPRYGSKHWKSCRKSLGDHGTQVRKLPAM